MKHNFSFSSPYPTLMMNRQLGISFNQLQISKSDSSTPVFEGYILATILLSGLSKARSRSFKEVVLSLSILNSPQRVVTWKLYVLMSWVPLELQANPLSSKPVNMKQQMVLFCPVSFQRKKNWSFSGEIDNRSETQLCSEKLEGRVDLFMVKTLLC